MGLGIKTYFKNLKAKKFFRQFIQKDDLVFDCGANHGKYTDYFLSLNANVICIEANTYCCDFLQNKYASNSSIVILNKGLSEKVGEAIFNISNNNQISSFSEKFIHLVGQMNSSFNWNKKQKTPTTNLNQLIEQYGMPAFCKIDVEGYEYKVLSGLSQSIPTISIEYNKPFLQDTIDCIQLISQLDNYIFNISYFEYFKLINKKWLSSNEMTHFLQTEIPSHILTGELYAKLDA